MTKFMYRQLNILQTVVSPDPSAIAAQRRRPAFDAALATFERIQAAFEAERTRRELKDCGRG